MTKRKRLRQLKKKSDDNDSNDEGVFKTKSPFDHSQLPNLSNTESLANFIENAVDILGNVDTNAVISNLTYTLRKYDAQKSCTIQQFYTIISVHPYLAELVEEVKFLEQKDNVIPKFVLLTQASRQNQRTG